MQAWSLLLNSGTLIIVAISFQTRLTDPLCCRRRLQRLWCLVFLWLFGKAHFFTSSHALFPLSQQFPPNLFCRIWHVQMRHFTAVNNRYSVWGTYWLHTRKESINKIPIPSTKASRLHIKEGLPSLGLRLYGIVNVIFHALFTWWTGLCCLVPLSLTP